MSNEPLISVVLPVYNGEQYLPAALDSILAQTLRDFEIIAIDDGSTDGTLAILRDYERKDSRIRVVTRGNMNLPNTLNEGVDLARGTWIARMDHDDVAMPHRFERQIAWLMHTGADIAGSWIRPFGSGDRRIVKHATTDDAIKVEMLFGSPFAHPTVMMRTELVRLLRYDPAWHGAEDYDLWERAVTAGWSMSNVPEVLLNYRMHPEQISTSTRSGQQRLTYKIQHRYFKSMCGLWSLTPEMGSEIIRVREYPDQVVNLDLVDAAVLSLVSRIKGDDRRLIISEIFKLYVLAAARSKGAGRRWASQNRALVKSLNFHQYFQLRLVEILDISPTSTFFKKIKRIYRFLDFW
ncbi:glycosyltransferase family 2 protein [Dechloromonas sp.]|uniref:glycosyltransferase family 2 protein n=1 Tax=Dechloromonas sp. TaxID=1917218 RepID=UPI00286EAD4D|nr:glycosyltransferase [Dechloromonas sp.]